MGRESMVIEWPSGAMGRGKQREVNAGLVARAVGLPSRSRCTAPCALRLARPGRVGLWGKARGDEEQLYLTSCYLL
jgi:hypothetical protein